MSCEHCEALRAAIRAAVDVERDPEVRRLMFLTAGMASCRCECHTPARIAGGLPRLAVAS